MSGRGPFTTRSEEWRSVPGFEGLYRVSSLGRVRSLTRLSFDGRIIRGRTLRPSPGSNGYPKVTLCRDGENHTVSVHRLILEAFRGPAPEGFEARHLNGVKTDNRLSNLEWGSLAENAADKVEHGTAPRGERHPLAKLTEADVIKIRRRLAAGEFQREIAADFGVSRSAVSVIATGRTWSHLRAG